MGLESKRILAPMSKTSAVEAPSVLPIDPSQILTFSEIAERLKVSDRWVYEKTRARCQNPLPTIRIGRYLRFHWLDVSAWLQRQRSSGVA
jgi:excisionase family DNA binding protein